MILFFGRGRPDHGTHPWLAALVGHQGSKQRLTVNAVRLRSSTPARYRDRGGIDDMAFNPLFLEHSVYPEAVEPGLLNRDDRVVMPGSGLASFAQFHKQSKQPGHVPSCHGMLRHLLAAPRRYRCYQPLRTAKFHRHENCAKISADGGRLGGSCGHMHRSPQD